MFKIKTIPLDVLRVAILERFIAVLQVAENDLIL